MRIDLVTDTYEPDVNGVAMTLGRLAKGLKARGHLIHVLRAAGEDGPFLERHPCRPSPFPFIMK